MKSENEATSKDPMSASDMMLMLSKPHGDGVGSDLDHWAERRSMDRTSKTAFSGSSRRGRAFQ